MADHDSSSDEDDIGLISHCKPFQPLPTMFPYHADAQEEEKDASQLALSREETDIDDSLLLLEDSGLFDDEDFDAAFDVDNVRREKKRKPAKLNNRLDDTNLPNSSVMPTKKKQKQTGASNKSKDDQTRPPALNGTKKELDKPQVKTVNPVQEQDDKSSSVARQQDAHKRIPAGSNCPNATTTEEESKS